MTKNWMPQTSTRFASLAAQHDPRPLAVQAKEHGAAEHQNGVADHDRQHSPERQGAVIEQRQQQGDIQGSVDEGVEDAAEVALDMIPTGDEAVGDVAQGGKEEEYRRRPGGARRVAAVEPHEHRQRQQAEHGERVGDLAHQHGASLPSAAGGGAVAGSPHASRPPIMCYNTALGRRVAQPG